VFVSLANYCLCGFGLLFCVYLLIYFFYFGCDFLFLKYNFLVLIKLFAQNFKHSVFCLFVTQQLFLIYRSSYYDDYKQSLLQLGNKLPQFHTIFFFKLNTIFMSF